jgi:hypothetical protein
MAERLLTYVQNTPLALWVSESPSLLGYPTILVLHTFGLALVVGGSVAVSLRFLGVARAATKASLQPLFGPMWLGLAVNAVTGVLLFIADAVRKAGQPVFWIKIAAIAAALLLLMKIGAIVRAADADGPLPVSARGKRLAWLLLACWAVAIVAGRLMAYQ